MIPVERGLENSARDAFFTGAFFRGMKTKRSASSRFVAAGQRCEFFVFWNFTSWRWLFRGLRRQLPQFVHFLPVDAAL